MNCRQVEAKIADWSADNLPQSCCDEMRAHIEACPSCARRWVEFQATLQHVSTSTQPLLSPEKSRAMWACCEEHIADKNATSASRSAPMQNAPRNSWWQIQPRWGWFSLAGACAVLGAVWLAPASMLNRTEPTRIAQNKTFAPRDEWVRFSVPPAQASSFINHHTAMAFDPFADHAASTLVSDAATNAIPVSDVSVEKPSRNP